MDMGLKDKVALVTGGSDGIGKAAASSLAAEGAKVVICARRPDVLEKAADDIRTETGAEVMAVPTDVTNPDQIKSLFDNIIATYGRIDILVNNAGTSAAGYFEEVADETWQADLDLKLFGAHPMLSHGHTPHEGPGRRPHHQHNHPRWQDPGAQLGAHVRQPRRRHRPDQGPV